MPVSPLTLFSQVRLQYGNVGLLGRSILAAEQLCRASGVTLSFVSAEEFLAVNEANRDTWLPVASILNPSFSDVHLGNSFFIVGRNAAGEAVACQACRFFDWTHTNFKDECESLRLWYRDPQAMKNADERSVVSSLAAHGTTGLVAYSGAAWYRPDFRGKGLSAYLPRLSRAYARALWNTDVTITLMSQSIIRQGVLPRAGYCNMEWDVSVINNRSGTIRFAYIWSKADEMEAELDQYLAGLQSKFVDGRERAVG